MRHRRQRVSGRESQLTGPIGHGRGGRGVPRGYIAGTAPQSAALFAAQSESAKALPTGMESRTERVGTSALLHRWTPLQAGGRLFESGTAHSEKPRARAAVLAF
jgi:hypothetical protein